MDFFLNELSLHNQFESFPQFLSSLQTIFKCKDNIERYGFRLYCERKITNRKVLKNHTFSSIIFSQQNLDLKRKVGIWLQKTGPFWDDLPRHDPDDYFEYEQEPLENASLAEVAFLIASEQRQYSTLSFRPSQFGKTPLLVRWYKTDPPYEVEILNFWEHDTLQSQLEQLRPPVTSWIDLIERAKSDFPNLIFLDSVELSLEGEAFSSVIADRVTFQLELLNKFADYIDDQGRRTKIGHELYESYFMGDRAVFSDESVSNKRDFQNALIFKKPDGEEIFCPFHGKISHRTFRIHFSWPIRNNEPIYIAYIGPKITKH